MGTKDRAQPLNSTVRHVKMNEPKTIFGKLYLDFAKALCNEEYDEAYLMLSAKLKEELSPGILGEKFHNMFNHFGDPPTEIELIEEIDDFESEHPSYLGWAYVAISGFFKDDDIGRWSEAVSGDVISENGTAVIDYIEWGRP